MCVCVCACSDPASVSVCRGEEPAAACGSRSRPGLPVLTEGQVGQAGAGHGEPQAHDQGTGNMAALLPALCLFPKVESAFEVAWKTSLNTKAK